MSTDPDATMDIPVVESLDPLPPFPAPAPFPWFPIGDALIASLPGFDALPCGHCGEVFTDAPAAVLTAVRPLMELRHLAREAGWNYDLSLIWSCPECRTDPLAAFDRAAKKAAAEAEHGHHSLLAYADGRFEDVMAARGGEFTCRWPYADDAPEADRWAA